MLKIDLRLAALALAGMLAAIPMAQAQSAPPTQDEIKYDFPGPESVWRVLGIKEPNQLMLVRAASPASDGLPRVQMLFVYWPATNGFDRIDNYYSVDCKARKIRDDGGTVWAKGKYQGDSPSETNSALADAKPDSVHEGVIRFACDDPKKFGELRKRDAAIARVVDWAKERQAGGDAPK